MKKRSLRLILIGLGLLFSYFLVYTVLTPFIRGVVVDATTKKPVGNAWVVVAARITAFTIVEGKSLTSAVSFPHTRTDKNGVFYVRPRLFLTLPLFPILLGRGRSDLVVTVRVPDGRRAEVDFRKDWGKRILLVTIPVKQEERKIDEIWSELNKLTVYCERGLYASFYPAGGKPCDEWELDYTIAENEKFLKTPLNSVDPFAMRSVYYSSVMSGLAYLYEKKGDLKKALELARAVRESDLKVDSFSLKEHTDRVKELEDKLKQK